MTEYTEHLLTEPRKDTERFRIVWLVTVPLVAILFQVYVPRFVSFLSYLELPLLITVHFALSSRGPIASVVKTLVGYFAASVSMRFDVANPFVTFILSFFFYFFHQFFYWVLDRALLGEALSFDVQQTLIFGLLNAAVALPLFRILDKLKVTG
jgi:rod shape-determining protein MreD